MSSSMTRIGRKPPDGPSTGTPDNFLAPKRLARFDERTGQVVYPYVHDGGAIDPPTDDRVSAVDEGRRLQRSLRLHAGDGMDDDLLHQKYPDAPNFKTLRTLIERLHENHDNEIAQKRLAQTRQEMVAKIELWCQRVAEDIEAFEPVVDTHAEDDAWLHCAVLLDIQEPDERPLRPEERKFYDYLRIMRPAFDCDVAETKYAMVELAAHIVERLSHERSPSELTEHARVIASECMRAIAQRAALPNGHPVTLDMATLLVRVMRALPFHKRETPLLTASSTLREAMTPTNAHRVPAIKNYTQLAHWFGALEEEELRFGECTEALRTLTRLTTAADAATSDAAHEALDYLRHAYPALMQRADDAQHASVPLSSTPTTPATSSVTPVITPTPPLATVLPFPQRVPTR